MLNKLLQKYGAVIVSLAAIVLATLHISKQIEVDSTGLILLVIIVLPWVFPLIKSLKIFGFEYERLEEIEKDVATLLVGGSENLDTDDGDISEAATGLTQQQQAVLGALKHQTYIFRTATGVKNTAGLKDRTEAKKHLSELVALGLARQRTGKSGQELWALTAEGKAAISSLPGSVSPDG